MINVNLNPRTIYKAPTKNNLNLSSKVNKIPAFKGNDEKKETTIKLSPNQRKAAMAMLLSLSTIFSQGCSNDEQKTTPLTYETSPSNTPNPSLGETTEAPTPKEMTFEELLKGFTVCTDEAFTKKWNQGNLFGDEEVDSEMVTLCPDVISGIAKLPPQVGGDLLASGRMFRKQLSENLQAQRQKAMEESAPPPQENTNSDTDPNDKFISPAEMAAIVSRTPEGRAMVEQQMRDAEADRISQQIRDHNQRIREEAADLENQRVQREIMDSRINRMRIDP